MKPPVIKARNLLDAWIKACAFVFHFGDQRRGADGGQREIVDLSITIKNSYEMDHELYFHYFSKDIYEKVLSIYRSVKRSVAVRSYAERIYRYNGLNQVEMVERILSRDSLSKSATIVLSNPNEDKCHLPCVMDVNFKIRDEKLIMTAIFKSSDIARKFPPDIFSLSEIHRQVSQKLKIARGAINIFIMSAQIHSNDYRKVQKLIGDKHTIVSFNETKTVENWNKEASSWNENIGKSDHYTNINDGYNRFLKFTRRILNENRLGTNESCLDSGCGTGAIAKLLKRYSNRVYGIDIADRMILESRKNVRGAEFILANCLDIPFSDNFFQVIVSRGVLISHVGKNHSDIFIKEAHRTLKNGGLFLFDFITHFNSNEFKKKKNKAVLSKKTISQKLNSHDFKVIEFLGDDKYRVNAVLAIKK